MLRLLAAAPLVLIPMLATPQAATAATARPVGMHTNFHVYTPPHPAGTAVPATLGPSGHIPCDLTAAYYMNGSAYDGTGVTIAIVDAYDQPNIAADLAAFDSTFGVPAPPSFIVAKQGIDFPGSIPPGDPGWGTEVSLDIEWAHAMAPGAAIVLVEAQDNFTSSLLAAVDYAVNSLQADIVSMSWGGPESGLTSADIAANDTHFPGTGSHGQPVMYLAAAGDNYFESDWPADSSRIIGVGGTSVTSAGFGGLTMSNRTNCSGAMGAGVTSANETVWGTNLNHGTGGGQSTLVSKPSWQSGFGPAGTRNIPDVAMLADPATGVAIRDTYGTSSAWTQIGGTSLATPLWAGVLARVDQERTSFGVPRLNVTPSTNPLYAISASSFNDIIAGDSPTGGNPAAACISAGTCVAAVGYDLVTGRGSPKYSTLITALNGASAPGAPPSAAATAGDRTARVSWTAAPANNSAITSYIVTCVGSPCPSALTVSANTLSTVVTGLTNGHSYTFNVAATNAIGTGPVTASNSVTPVARIAPEAPTPTPIPTAGRTPPGSSTPLPTVSPRANQAVPAQVTAPLAAPAPVASLSQPAASADASAPVIRAAARGVPSWVWAGQLVGLCDT